MKDIYDLLFLSLFLAWILVTRAPDTFPRHRKHNERGFQIFLFRIRFGITYVPQCLDRPQRCGNCGEQGTDLLCTYGGSCRFRLLHAPTLKSH